jgi:hypothetical protein
VADAEVTTRDEGDQRSRGSILVWVLIILVIALAGIALILYWYYRPTIEYVGFRSHAATTCAFVRRMPSPGERAWVIRFVLTRDRATSTCESPTS